MKIFGRTGGYYLFWCSSVYLVVGLTCAVYYKVIPAEVIQLVWLLVLALPFLVPPIGRYFNMNVEWDRKMFDWYVRNQRDIAMFIAGWCALAALDCFGKGDWLFTAVNIGLGWLNIKLAK